MSVEGETSEHPFDAPDDLIAVAKAVKTRGLRGEIVADLLTDFPERFEGLEELIAVAPDGKRIRLRLEEHWLHQDRIVFKFEGYDSIEAASALVGYELTVPESERVELEEDEFYDWELVGCRVETVEGEQLGRVREVLRTGANDVLVVEGDAKREYLIPLAEEICVRVDIEEKLIRVDAPEGLLEF
ncbi:MAG: ribosome maturation factor RimM [Pyrinomonadaceae bacterium]